MSTTGDLEVLDAGTCWELLRARSIGRFVANRPGSSPFVVPVNYAIDSDGDIVIRTGPGSKVDVVSHDLVSLEIDELDAAHHVGWSVVVEGSGRAVAATERDAELETWAPGEKPYVLRIRPIQITGRRIQLHTPDTDERGYR